MRCYFNSQCRCKCHSVKRALPAVVPDMGYGELEEDNGLDASALFVYMAQGRHDSEQASATSTSEQLHNRLITLTQITSRDPWPLRDTLGLTG